MIDDIDGKILTILQENARISNANIARELGVAPSGVFERIKKLEQRGIIKGYHAALDHEKLGQGVTAFLILGAGDRVGSIEGANRVAKIDEVVEVQNIAGEDGILVKLRCGSNEELGRILREKIGSIPSIRSSRTFVVMETIKEQG